MCILCVIFRSAVLFIALKASCTLYCRYYTWSANRKQVLLLPDDALCHVYCLFAIKNYLSGIHPVAT